MFSLGVKKIKIKPLKTPTLICVLTVILYFRARKDLDMKIFTKILCKSKFKTKYKLVQHYILFTVKAVYVGVQSISA